MMLRPRVHDDFGGAIAAEAADTCAHAHVRIRARCLHDERAGCGYWLRLLFRKRNSTYHNTIQEIQVVAPPNRQVYTGAPCGEPGRFVTQHAQSGRA
jgi:hypothetical protein